jgi:glycerol-3-phosphate dehydrogenase
MPLKIAMIGAGSIGFTRRLMGDLLTVPEFAETTFAFTDINQHNLDMVTQLARRDIAGNDLPAAVEATTDRRAAIADADYVICMIRQAAWKASRPTSTSRSSTASTSASATRSAPAASCTASAASRRFWSSAKTSVRSPSLARCF